MRRLPMPISEDEPDNQRFIIDTSNSNDEEVEGLLKSLFGEDSTLVTVELTADAARTEAENQPGRPKRRRGKTPEKPVAPTIAKPAEKSATRPEDKPSEPPMDKSRPKPAEQKTAEKPTTPTIVKPAEKSTTGPKISPRSRRWTSRFPNRKQSRGEEAGRYDTGGKEASRDESEAVAVGPAVAEPRGDGRQRSRPACRRLTRPP